MYSGLRMLETKNFRNWMSACSPWQRLPALGWTIVAVLGRSSNKSGTAPNVSCRCCSSISIDSRPTTTPMSSGRCRYPGDRRTMYRRQHPAAGRQRCTIWRRGVHCRPSRYIGVRRHSDCRKDPVRHQRVPNRASGQRIWMRDGQYRHGERRAQNGQRSVGGDQSCRRGLVQRNGDRAKQGIDRSSVMRSIITSASAALRRLASDQSVDCIAATFRGGGTRRKMRRRMRLYVGKRNNSRSPTCAGISPLRSVKDSLRQASPALDPSCALPHASGGRLNRGLARQFVK